MRSGVTYAEVDVKNRFELGDALVLMTTAGNHSFTLQHLQDKHGMKLVAAPGSGHVVWLPLPANHDNQPLQHAMLLRQLFTVAEPETAVPIQITEVS